MPSSMTLRSSYLGACLLLASLLTGCATAPGRTTSDDPWQGLNRGVYKFNDTVDSAAVKPVAKGYQKITPRWFRTGISNFFSNLSEPWTMVNDLLQGKPKMMAQDTSRFVLNTIVGLGGFIDVAEKLELSPHAEDFGQTLAVWGVPSGPYLMLPFFGPSTVRDGFGRIPDYYSAPQRNLDLPWETRTGLTTLDVIQSRERLLGVEDTLNQAYDKYGIMRDAWLQRREYQIYDGNPPEPSLDDESGLEDESPGDDAKDANPDAAADSSAAPPP